MLFKKPPQQKPYRVGISGTGFISKGLSLFLQSTKDLKLTKVLTRRTINSCKDYPLKKILTNSEEELLDHCDVLVECSGNVIHAAQIIDKALKARIPIVTLNSEFHVTCGSYFKNKGLLTESHGDQPGTLACLHENAVQMGFKPLVFCNIKGFHDLNPTPENMIFWAKKQGLSLPMVTSSTDGTKLQFEQALVANGLGATITQEGMTGVVSDDINSAVSILGKKAKKIGRPIADYIRSRVISDRVIIIAEHEKNQKEYLSYLKFGNGPFYLLREHILLCHLEAAKTIRRVLSGKGVLLNIGLMPSIGVAAVAKRKLTKGTLIRQGIGSFDVRGTTVKIAKRPNHVPLGLLYNAVITKNIHPGEILTFNDVEIHPTIASKGYQSILKNITSKSK